MSDKTGISWAEATPYYVSSEGRWRTYQRVRNDRPGAAARRRMAAAGFRWCRGCNEWLRSDLVLRQGVCKEHANAEYRRHYAKNPDAIKQRTARRKRSVVRLPEVAKVYILEQCDGCCVYCGAKAQTFDHVLPTSSGGETLPGNIVPACLSCNSSKKDSEVWEWLAKTGRTPSLDLIDILALRHLV